MNTKPSLAFIFVLLLLSLTVASIANVSVTSAADTVLSVDYDVHVVAGFKTDSPALPPADTQPAGFHFNLTKGGIAPQYTANESDPTLGVNSALGGFDFGRIERDPDFLWFLEKGWVQLNITNQLGYDIVITGMRAEMTNGTTSDDFVLTPGYLQCLLWGGQTPAECRLNWTYGNNTMVYYDAFDYLDLFTIYEYQNGLTNSICSLGGNRLEAISRAD